MQQQEQQHVTASGIRMRNFAAGAEAANLIQLPSRIY
jgi:hypothetical protein